MAPTNQERVGAALDLLKEGLGPFIQREVKRKFSAASLKNFVDDPVVINKPIGEWDAAALLKLMWDSWNEVFRDVLGPFERGLVGEIRGHRNTWAHQGQFSSDDADRALDSIKRLLLAVSAPQATDVDKMKLELMRLRFDEQVRGEKRKAAGSAIETGAPTALKPWREVIAPHEDVASGRYQTAEFAADLWQVHIGEGIAEYQDPAEFFRRTYLTDGLKGLLVNAVQRISGQGGNPVVQLRTNFGGGKTHSLLALYHLFSGGDLGALLGINDVMADAGVSVVPPVRRVVLVGTKISPGNPTTKPDGTVVNTLWGELAWQLGGKEAFARIASVDGNSSNPSDELRALFNDYGPCMVLIDEWVAYARQLHDEKDLPAGDFSTQMSFAQSLSESAKLANNCLLVVSIPASQPASDTGPDTPSFTEAEDAELGGRRGREALSGLTSHIGRTGEYAPTGGTADGFEIVRRRLFDQITDPANFKDRDVVTRSFAELYRTQSAEFPPESREAAYEERIKATYPIHPELFDRLSSDWATLPGFQRTRGVLRLMAAVIHSLWEKGDTSPLIMPANVSIDDPRVLSELTRYLPDNWIPVIERDVDGPTSIPLRLDLEVPNLGKVSAARRVARTIYMGSAPLTQAAHRGVDDRHVKLGCVMPGESPAVFGDALRRLAASATFLYQDGPRSWYATQPTVTKLADDRAEQLKRDPDKIADELERRLREDLKNRGDFARVHPMVRSGSDVQDDMEARLVVLPPEYPHSRDESSAARKAAQTILDSRGSAPRLYRNTLTFLAADPARMHDLDEAIRRYLAWSSILEEIDTLNLDQHQIGQAKTQQAGADSSVEARLPETYMWALVPVQKTPTSPVEWEEFRLAGNDPLAARASKKLRSEELLITNLGATVLRKHLDDVPLWSGDHVSVREVIDYFARYLYLPRVAGPNVLVTTMQEGVRSLTWSMDTFAYAEGWDDSKSRYLGLQGAQLVSFTADSPGLLVNPDAAERQLSAETAAAPSSPASTDATGGDAEGTAPVMPAAKSRPKRYHGTTGLDPTRVGRDAGRIAEEVIAHLAGLQGAEVKVTLEIEAEVPDGVSDQVVRIVLENGNSLKFISQEFEQE